MFEYLLLNLYTRTWEGGRAAGSKGTWRQSGYIRPQGRVSSGKGVGKEGMVGMLGDDCMYFHPWVCQLEAI